MKLEASLELSGLLRLESRYAEAIEVLERTLDSHPAGVEDRKRDIATLRTAKGEVERGLGELQALAEAEPEVIWNWLVLGNESRIEGRLRESEMALDRALQIARQKGEARALTESCYQRFRLFRDMGRTDEAVQAWEEALASAPEVAATTREVATMLIQAGRYTDAQRYAERDENPLQAGFQRGLIAHLTGNGAKARDEWQAVAKLDPTQFEYGYDCWAEAVLRLGNPVPALEKLGMLLQGHGTARLLILSGIAWAMHKDPEIAARLFQQAINLLRRGRPAKQKIDGADWKLLDSLVRDEEAKARLKPYFAVVETLWDRPLSVERIG
jgi:tetratricopeptide (TPR) repeat protein